MLKKKLYITILLFCIVASLSGIQNAKAHSPYSMLVSYSISTSSLTVMIDHEVTDPTSHYISLIEVQVNGTTVISQTYTNQTSTSGATYHFNVTANNEARIVVTATCNQGGSGTICYIVGVGACPSEGGPQISGYFGLSVIFSVSVIVFIAVIHRKLKNKTK